jgi:hypothetical protein
VTRAHRDYRTFVSAIAPGNRQWREPETIDVVPIPATDIAPAMKPTNSPTRDSISATDRANGFNRRMVLPMALTVVLALVGVLFWSLTLAFLDVGQVAPYMLDRMLVFLAIVGGMGMVVWTKANEVDHDHTHSGVERHRISTAAEIRKVEVQAELEQRKMAVGAMLTMLESRERLEMSDHE